MVQQELERLVVTIVLNNFPYIQGAAQTSAVTNQMAKDMQDAAVKAKEFISQIQAFSGAAAGLFALGGVSVGIGSLIDAYKSHDKESKLLASTLASNNREIIGTTRSYQQFASTMQTSTGLESEYTLRLLRIAEGFSLTGDAAKRAAQQAIALGSATGHDAESMLRITTALAVGDTARAQAMARLVPQLRGVRDQSEFVIRVNALMNAGWSQAVKDIDSFSGRIQQAKSYLQDIAAEMGGSITSWLKPLTGVFLSITKWVSDLDDEAKKIIAVVVTIGSALGSVATFIGVLNPALPFIRSIGSILLSLVNPISIIKAAFAALGTVIGFVFSPIGLVIATVAVIVGVLISKAGGLAEAWEYVKSAAGVAWDWITEKTLAFMEWFSPIWQAIKGVAAAAWEGIVLIAVAAWDILVAGWEIFKDVVISIWDSVTGGASVSWSDVKEFILTALLAGEFAIRNFGQVAEWVWAGIKFGFVKFVNEVVYFFKEVIPTSLMWFKDNWLLVFLGVAAWTVDALATLGKNIVTVFTNIPWGDMWEGLKNSVKKVWENVVSGFGKMWDLIKDVASGRKNVGEAISGLWTDVVNNVQNQLERIPDAMQNGLPPLNLPPRVAGALEEQLRKEFNELGGALSTNWEAFRERRMREIMTPTATPAQVATSRQSGMELGAAFNSGLDRASKELKGIENYTAEALSRISSYKEQFLTRATTTATFGLGGGLGGGTSVGATAPVPVAAGAPASPPIANGTPSAPINIAMSNDAEANPLLGPASRMEIVLDRIAGVLGVA